MVRFKKIRWKNFLSTGNAFNEIDLDTGQVTLLAGRNGFGKCNFFSTKINISIEDEEINKKFIEFMRKNDEEY